MRKNLKVSLINVLLISLCSCSTKDVIFDHSCMYFDNNNYYSLIEMIEGGDIQNFERIREDFPKIDVSIGLGGDSESSFLFGLDEYLFKYNQDSNELLMLTQYLRFKYKSTNELYDKMLRASIRLDNSNICSLYLLAKLRFENGMFDKSFQIVQYIHDNLDEKKIRSEYVYLRRELSSSAITKSSLKQILDEEIYYID